MKKFIITALALLPVLAQAQPFQYQKTSGDFKHYRGQVTLAGT
ncbi:hypothetical protein [Acinetobacter sp. ANC 5584]